jgi:hypothetical protein
MMGRIRMPLYSPRVNTYPKPGFLEKPGFLRLQVPYHTLDPSLTSDHGDLATRQEPVHK